VFPDGDERVVVLLEDGKEARRLRLPPEAANHIARSLAAT